MRSRLCLSAVIMLAALTAMAGPQEKPSVAAAPAQSESVLPYRILQMVSAGNMEQQINETAAAGYRFLMLQPTAGAAGVTVLMKRVEGGAAPCQYRLLLAEPGKDRLQRVLNQAGSGGFRLVADSLLIAPFEPRGAEMLLWPAVTSGSNLGGRMLNPGGSGKKARPMTYVAVAEKAPGGPTNYEYRVTSAMRESSVQKDLRETSGQGFRPVVSTMEFPSFVPRFVVVFEKDMERAKPAEGIYVFAKIGEFPGSADPETELTIDITAATAATLPGEEKDVQAEQEKQDGTGETEAGSRESGPSKLKLHAGAIAASRVVFVPHLIYLDNAWLVAEKRPEAPSPNYRLVLRADLAGLEDALNKAGGEGFRLLPDGLVDTARRFKPGLGDVRDEKHNRHVLAVLQREGAANKYQYRILHSDDDAVALLKQMNEAATQGYNFAYMWRANVVMEKAPEPASKGGGL